MNKPTKVLLALCLGYPLMAQAPSLAGPGLMSTQALPSTTSQDPHSVHHESVA